jgi:hypothetical protein
MTERRHSIDGYELQREDYVALTSAIKSRLSDVIFVSVSTVFNTLGFIAVFGLLSGVLLAQVMTGAEFRANVPAIPMAIIGVGGLIYLLLLFYVLQPYVRARGFYRQGVAKRTRAIAISPSLIELKAGAVTSTLPWTEVDRVAVTATHIFIFTSEVGAFIIPARVFANVQAAKDFGDDARAWHAAARQGKP